MFLVPSKEFRRGSQYFGYGTVNYFPVVVLIKLETEHNFITIIYCYRNHYIILGNQTILSEVWVNFYKKNAIESII